LRDGGRLCTLSGGDEAQGDDDAAAPAGLGGDGTWLGTVDNNRNNSGSGSTEQRAIAGGGGRRARGGRAIACRDSIRCVAAA
jgi:hypothetical protein